MMPGGGVSVFAAPRDRKSGSLQGKGSFSVHSRCPYLHPDSERGRREEIFLWLWQLPD